MAQLHNPARGREVFLEENVSWLLNLPQNMEIDDHAQGAKRFKSPQSEIVNLRLRLNGFPYEFMENLMLLNHCDEKTAIK